MLLLLLVVVIPAPLVVAGAAVVVKAKEATTGARIAAGCCCRRHHHPDDEDCSNHLPREKRNEKDRERQSKGSVAARVCLRQSEAGNRGGRRRPLPLYTPPTAAYWQGSKGQRTSVDPSCEA